MNSTLEKPELKIMLADNLGVPENQITEDQLDWHFGQIDENNDGKITFQEYVPINLYLRSIISF